MSFFQRFLEYIPFDRSFYKIYKKSSFIIQRILMKNINKTPKKIENVHDDGNELVSQEKMTFHPTYLCFCKNKLANFLFRCLF